MHYEMNFIFHFCSLFEYIDNIFPVTGVVCNQKMVRHLQLEVSIHGPAHISVCDTLSLEGM